MITTIGLGNDPTICHFLGRCSDAGVEVNFVDLHELAGADWLFPLPGGDARWRSGGREQLLSASGRFYFRPIDISSAIQSARHSLSWQAMIQALGAWLETIDGTVVNRPGYAQDNASKPLHEALLARYGLAVPATITSSDRAALMAFAAQPAVVKTISGARADCWKVTPEDFADFAAESGPVHLQRRIDGADIRAHVVGRTVIAVRVDSGATDYRLDGDAIYTPVELPPRLARRLTDSARDMGLAFSGWDFKLDADGVFWLLEANPMPGYNSYDRRLGGRITDALVDLLYGRAS